MKLISACLILLLSACANITPNTSVSDEAPQQDISNHTSQKQLLLGKWACQAKEDGVLVRYITELQKDSTYNSRLILEIQDQELGDEAVRVGAKDQGTWLLNTKGHLEMTTSGGYEFIPLDKTPMSVVMAQLMKKSMNEELEKIGNTSVSEIMKLDENSLITNDITEVDGQSEDLISYCQRDTEV